MFFFVMPGVDTSQSALSFLIPFQQHEQKHKMSWMLHIECGNACTMQDSLDQYCHGNIMSNHFMLYNNTQIWLQNNIPKQKANKYGNIKTMLF